MYTLLKFGLRNTLVRIISGALKKKSSLQSALEITFPVHEFVTWQLATCHSKRLFNEKSISLIV